MTEPLMTWSVSPLRAAVRHGFHVRRCAKTPELMCMAPGHIDDGSCKTAILNILASPESYEGRTVSVLGFVEVVPGGDREAILLYSSRDARALQAATARTHS